MDDLVTKEHEVLVKHAPYGVVRMDDVGNVLSANDATCNLLGYTETELKGMRYREITHPSDASADSAEVTKLLNNRQPHDHYKIQKRFLHKRGTIVWVDCQVQVIKGDDGSCVHLLLTLQPVPVMLTELKVRSSTESADGSLVIPKPVWLFIRRHWLKIVMIALGLLGSVYKLKTEWDKAMERNQEILDRLENSKSNAPLDNP